MESNESFTTEKKAEKFDELMAEFGNLISYRHNLAKTVFSNIESIVEENQTESGGVVTKEVNKKFDITSLRNIQNEIARVDDLISFINNVIYGDRNTILESSINPENNF